MTATNAFMRIGTTSARHEASHRRLPFVVLAFLVAVLVPLQTSLSGTVITSVRMVVLIAVIPLLAGLLMGRYGRILITDWLFLAHTAWIGISLSFSTPDMALSQFGSVGPEFLGSYLIGRTMIRNKAQFTAVVRFLAWALVLLTPFTVFELMTGRPLIVDLLDKLPGLSSVGLVFYETRMGLERVQGVFDHPIHWGLFCSTLVSLVFIGLQGSISTFQRLWLLTAVVFGTFSSLSSGALLPMILQGVLIGWSVLFRNVRRRWLILALCTVVGWIVLEITSDRSAMMAVLTRLAFSSDNVYWRSFILDWGWMNTFGSRENGIPPARLFGIGLNDWVRPPWMYTASMDNFWLVMAVRYGVPGFLLVTGGYLALVWKVARRDLDPNSDLGRIRRAWVITFVSLGLSLCTVHIWTTLYAYTFFLLGIGAWLAFEEPPASSTADGQIDEEEPKRQARLYSRFGGSHPNPVRHAAQRNTLTRYRTEPVEPLMSDGLDKSRRDMGESQMSYDVRPLSTSA